MTKSDSSTSSAESEDSDLDSKEQGSNASGRVTIAGQQTKSTTEDSNQNEKNILEETSEKLIPATFQTLTSSARDFLARVSAMQEPGKASKIPEEHCFSRYVESRKLKNLHYYSLKMLEVFFQIKKEKRSKSSFNRWRNWGIGLNGKYLTADILFPKTESEYSLSDILEKEVDEKYFLSSSMVEYLRRIAMKALQKP